MSLVPTTCLFETSASFSAASISFVSFSIAFVIASVSFFNFLNVLMFFFCSLLSFAGLLLGLPGLFGLPLLGLLPGLLGFGLLGFGLHFFPLHGFFFPSTVAAKIMTRTKSVRRRETLILTSAKVRRTNFTPHVVCVDTTA